MLEALKGCNKAVGVKQAIKIVEGGKAKVAFIANDADERVISRFKELCLAGSVEIIYVDTMKQLGKACGIDVGTAAACLLK